MEAIFYCEFDPVQGPKVIYEIPEGLIKTTTTGTGGTGSYQHLAATTASSSRRDESWIDFDAISEYIIPKPILCNRLVTVCTPRYRVMGYPVSIEDPKYERNAFLFNLCFVFENSSVEHVDLPAYEQVVRKMSRILRSLEKESEFLHNAETKGTVLNIMEQLMQDIQIECQIPIDDANMINLKLLPTYPNPEPVRDWQVPVALLNIEKVMDKFWDMTLLRIVPFVNGVNSVKRIAELSDVEQELVRIGIQHLLYYGCIKMMDIFQFCNVYAVAPTINTLLTSPDIQSECREFVCRRINTDTPSLHRPPPTPPSFPILFRLYCSLKHGLTVREWVEENAEFCHHLDVRRFISFGVIKGFVYRVHKYPVYLPRGDVRKETDGKLRPYLK
ncbi:Nitrogen permease regulator 2 [Irineochytrium annulatum]|nr:Nitrogen permease regulator 2 [Irineochytrium annulatum]